MRDRPVRATVPHKLMEQRSIDYLWLAGRGVGEDRKGGHVGQRDHDIAVTDGSQAVGLKYLGVEPAD